MIIVELSDEELITIATAFTSHLLAGNVDDTEAMAELVQKFTRAKELAGADMGTVQ